VSDDGPESISSEQLSWGRLSRIPPLANRENCGADTVDLLFTNILTDEESMSFPRPFCLCSFAWIAIASVRRAQQVDRYGVCAVADGERCAAHYDGCGAMHVVASRVSRWLSQGWQRVPQG
jgi:hypothetical protein